MASLGELVDQVIGTLYGFTVDVPQAGTLTGNIGPDDTQLVVDFGQAQPGAARPNGLVEIDRELLQVSNFDAATGTIVVGPWGRGVRNTARAAHTAGTMVTVRPRYPRKQVIDAINQTVQASCPPLFAVRDLDPIPVGELVQLGYPLPADCIRVIRVEATPDGPPELVIRHKVEQWSIRDRGTRELVLPWYLPPYQSVDVTIACDPGRLTDDADDFATVTGLPTSAADMVVMGALSRLVLAAEAARQQSSTVEAANRNAQVPSGSATTLSRYYSALYTQRLQQEQQRLQITYPVQLVRRG